MYHDEWRDEDGAGRARRQHVMLYTVGLDGLEIKDILEILKKYSIDRIEDIRGLDKGEEEYFSLPPIFYSNEEGFSPKRSEFYLYPNGYLDFNLCRLSKKFRQAQWGVEKTLMGGKNILLLSEEHDPIDSHRGIGRQANEAVSSGRRENKETTLRLLSKTEHKNRMAPADSANNALLGEEWERTHEYL